MAMLLTMAVKEAKPNLNSLNHISLCHHEIYQASGTPRTLLPAGHSRGRQGLMASTQAQTRSRTRGPLARLMSTLRAKHDKPRPQKSGISLASLAVATSLLLAFTAIACFSMILLMD